MSTDIGGRPVLRPAGNVARATLRKATKPPPSPVKPQVLPPSSKISPPNSQPSTPKTAISSPARSPLLKPLSPSKLSPKKPPSPSPVSLTQGDQELSPQTPLPLASDGSSSEICNIVSSCKISELSSDGSNLSAKDPLASVNGFSPSPLGSASANDGSKPSLNGSSLVNGDGNGLEASPHGVNTSCNGSNPSQNGSELLSSVGKTSQNPSKSSSHPPASRSQRTINPHISLNKSSSDVFQRGPSSHVKAKPTSKKNLSKLGSLSFDEGSLATMVAAKKAAANEVNAQRKLKVSEYGRKQGKASRIAPDISTALLSPPAPVELKRCKFITAQSDPVYVAYHDQEWGVPIHDDRMLFEHLVLAGLQVELSWTTILHNREAYRDVFAGFDPSVVALFKEKHIQSLEADKSLGLPAGKIRGVVDNAQRLLEVVHEFGSFDEYMWRFLNKQPMMNNYRYPKQVPVKTSKAESISKDLVKRGFRFVGPTIIYSFMQASGMTNDHLVQCFRHQECAKLSSPFEDLHEEKQGVALQSEDREANLLNCDFGLEKEEGLEEHFVDRECDCEREQDACSQQLEGCTTKER